MQLKKLFLCVFIEFTCALKGGLLLFQANIYSVIKQQWGQGEGEEDRVRVGHRCTRIYNWMKLSTSANVFLWVFTAPIIET
jgi:hypothetical protein